MKLWYRWQGSRNGQALGWRRLRQGLVDCVSFRQIDYLENEDGYSAISIYFFTGIHPFPIILCSPWYTLWKQRNRTVPITRGRINREVINSDLTVRSLTRARCIRFICPKCGRSYQHLHHMLRHYKFECGSPPRFQCPYCQMRSKQSNNVYKHIRVKHPGSKLEVVVLQYEQ